MDNIPRQTFKAATIYDCFDQLNKAKDALIASELINRATDHLQQRHQLFSQEILNDFETAIRECQNDFNHFLYLQACQCFEMAIDEQRKRNQKAIGRIELVIDNLISKAVSSDEDESWRAITSLTDLVRAYGTILSTRALTITICFLIQVPNSENGEVVCAAKLELKEEVYELLETDFDLLN